jgi:hypothetical protein
MFCPASIHLARKDAQELERMLAESGIGAPEDLEKAKEDNRGLGLFIRSLVGLDRGAAKHAFAAFLGAKTLKANQIEFVNLIVDQLTDHGVMKAERLYESPLRRRCAAGTRCAFHFRRGRRAHRRARQRPRNGGGLLSISKPRVLLRRAIPGREMANFGALI